MGEAPNYNDKLFDEEPKPHTKISIHIFDFRDWPKQRDNVSRIAHLQVPKTPEGALCVKRCFVVSASFENIFF